ncbi:MAG: glycosyltransferase family protein [Acholeplasma sp.]|nr:glycosyltransferase family protein [Acholeplasma sp.]
MKYLAIIQARNGSTRMPRKVLADIYGKTALLRTIERVKKSKWIDEVLVATSINKENLSIVKMCAENNVRVYIGSENDVLDRYYNAAKLLLPKYIIRVTADCPLYDAQILDWSISQMHPDSDYLMQESPETLPDGLDIEVIKFEALEKAWRHARLKSEREHVTQYIRKNPEIFNIQYIRNPLGDFGNERWTLDNEHDYQLILEIYKHFINEKNEFPNMKDIIDFLNGNPELRNVNRDETRDEGLKKSLEEDDLYE